MVKPEGTFLRVKVRGLFITVVGGGGLGRKVVAVFFLLGGFFNAILDPQKADIRA